MSIKGEDVHVLVRSGEISKFPQELLYAPETITQAPLNKAERDETTRHSDAQPRGHRGLNRSILACRSIDRQNRFWEAG